VLKGLQLVVTSFALVAACSSGDDRPVVNDFPAADGRCENRRPEEFLSKDRLYKAVRFSRRCGSELPSLNISVLPASAALPDEAGNVFIDVPPKDASGYATHVRMIWSEAHTLTIERNESMALEKSASAAGEVQVIHKVVPDAA
jgi:hypothetical protein